MHGPTLLSHDAQLTLRWQLEDVTGEVHGLYVICTSNSWAVSWPQDTSKHIFDLYTLPTSSLRQVFNPSLQGLILLVLQLTLKDLCDKPVYQWTAQLAMSMGIECERIESSPVSLYSYIWTRKPKSSGRDKIHLIASWIEFYLFILLALTEHNATIQRPK